MNSSSRVKYNRKKDDINSNDNEGNELNNSKMNKSSANFAKVPEELSSTFEKMISQLDIITK